MLIFCDRDSWHGNNWKIKGLLSLDDELANYSDFWAKKIRANILRAEQRVNNELKREGWLVVMFWAGDIRKSADKCAEKVVKYYMKRADMRL